MGFERIVSVLQGVDSNYKTDLFAGTLDVLSVADRQHPRSRCTPDFTPYRVIADHARSAAFLIADGVVPGNVGRNYVCRMIIRRAARFGTKIGLHEPFLAKVAEAIIAAYGDFYPELKKSREAILDNLTREEIRFARTVESGTAYLQSMLDELEEVESNRPGRSPGLRSVRHLWAAFRDLPRYRPRTGPGCGRSRFQSRHGRGTPPASGGGKAMGRMGGEDAEFFAGIGKDFRPRRESWANHGVEYDPYEGRG